MSVSPKRSAGPATLRGAVCRLALGGSLLTVALPASAQQSRPSRLAVDTTAAIDVSVSDRRNATSGLTTDALVSFDFGKGMQFVARPFFQRLGSSGEWNAQLWLAAVTYEHTGNVAVRVEGGIIPSPVGMANLLLRPHTNPTISLPASLFTPLPAAGPGEPRTRLLGAIYPFGISATVSASRWDVRTALIDTSPSRPRRIFSDGTPPNPPRLTNVIIGGGVTPFIGVRLGTSLTRGHWSSAAESPTTSEPRFSTVATVEADVAYRRTRVQYEWARDRFSTGVGHFIARGWFLQGTHTLSPRWFVAGRIERMQAPAFSSPGVADGRLTSQRFLGAEPTVGYRLTPELTVRVSHRIRKPFGSDQLERATAVSLVWWQRWR